MVRIGAISVGGRGARLQKNDIQKCLVPIEGKPILEYTVEAFLQVGITTIFLLTGFLHEQVDAYVVERNRKSDYSITSVFGGTKGQIPAILKLQGLVQEDFLFAGGDCIVPVDTLKKLIRSADKHKESVAVMSTTRTVDFLESHPRIELISGSRLIKKIYLPDEVEASSLVGRGIYYFRPTVFKFLSRVESTPPFLIAEFIKYVRLSGYSAAASITNDPVFCLHTPNDLAAWKNSEMRKLLKRS